MGNSESSHDEDYENFSRQPAPYTGYSVDTSYAPESPEHARSSTHTNYQHHPPAREHHHPARGGTSVNINHSKKQHSRYIADNFNSLDEVIDALREAGLESSNLILGIDFTKSNEWTGRYSFNRRSLHAIGSSPNPYEQAISIIGRTLSPFDEDNLIPCFGFGDATTHDQYVFSFYPDHRPCNGFEESLARYKEILPHLNLSGPTSFAPVIDAAVDIVEKSNFQYHVLVIIADGQVTRSPDTLPGRLSPQEQATINSIVAASEYPLSIILVGVGDGPWDAMKEFDDNIPQRAFDNFQACPICLTNPKDMAFGCGHLSLYYGYLESCDTGMLFSFSPDVSGISDMQGLCMHRSNIHHHLRHSLPGYARDIAILKDYANTENKISLQDAID
ncbi:UNVERIFIED_CONTAM: E3 ubiquitin-protein ligase RGLG3 [Sesamum calycinum]|uniref:E3 ubiquitin-protein ligase RGLG3 n=1 Tax=Sesamum calycinum TaxID=2727403 RepID=A0AAW2MQ49_9LAMI